MILTIFFVQVDLQVIDESGLHQSFRESEKAFTSDYGEEAVTPALPNRAVGCQTVRYGKEDECIMEER